MNFFRSSSAETIIIGAGPGGLSVAAGLRSRDLTYRVFERRPRPGGAYDILHGSWRMVSPSRYIPLPDSKPTWSAEFVPMREYRDYLHNYVETKSLSIETGVTVTHISAQNGQFQVELDRSKTVVTARNLVLATGMVSFPKPLDIETEDFPHITFESAAEWRGVDAYSDEAVLIVGSGTSATELASILASTRDRGSKPVVLLMREPRKLFPRSFLGVNTHHWLRPLEKLPRGFHSRFCQGSMKEPPFDFDLSRLKSEERLICKYGDFEIQSNGFHFQDGSIIPIRYVLNCTGFRFDTRILPDDVQKNANGFLSTHRNQSLSHPGLFVIGHPCSGNIDSKFLRGIRSDAISIARQIAERS